MIKFILKYDFLPKSILPRFIVKSNLEIFNGLKWRTGVVLEDKDLASIATIKVDYNEKIINIFVNGENRVEYFSVIRNRFSIINNSFQQLNWSELVPCICEECNKTKDPFFYNYKTLLKSKNKKRAFIMCEKHIVDVNIVELLRGIDMNVQETSWDVFISYSNKDSDMIDKLIDLLKSKKINYWLDKEQIKPGESISLKIENGLENCQNIILCISENQIESGWSRAEYTSLLHDILSNKTTKRIIPLIIDSLSSNSIPKLLKDFKYVKYADKDGMKELLKSIK